MVESDPAPPVRLLTLPAAQLADTQRAKAIVFHDPRSLELIAQLERIAPTEAPVLIVGETGTGKELVARHVHNRSGRRGPFLAVNCGAFSETLIDAELFGHEAGAYTGAVRARAGWFEAADGGTLFLDEIGDLSLGLQVKLLRVLQERQVTRLGARKSTAFDVRLVAATNVDLRQAVEAQQFRADLFYRLSVAAVSLPPLRQRAGDVLPLARHFIATYAPRLGHAQLQLSAEAEQALLDYPWPGNIRELENIIHFAVIVCRDGLIRASDLNLQPAASVAAAVIAPAAATGSAITAAVPAAFAAATPAVPAVAHPLADVIHRLLREASPNLYHAVEEALVYSAFAYVGENQVRAARALGITRNTLRTLLKRHGLLARSASDSSDSSDSGIDDSATS